jgi:hypothetical protein
MLIYINDFNLSMYIKTPILNYDKIVTTTIQLSDLQSLVTFNPVQINTNFYSNVFKPLFAFSNNGTSIYTFWIQQIALQLYNNIGGTALITNQPRIIQDLNKEYGTLLANNKTKLTDIFEKVQCQLKSNNRAFFEVGDQLLYTTTIHMPNNSVPSLTFLMQINII